MARIRTIKPEFFRHEGLQLLGACPMLVFSGLWTVADAKGVFLWKPRILKLDILPFIDFDMAETLEMLVGGGFLEHYEVEGKEYGRICNFNTHQRITGKEAVEGGRYPEQGRPVSRSNRETTGKQRGNNRSCPNVQEKEKEKEKEKDFDAFSWKHEEPSRDADAPPSAKAIAIRSSKSDLPESLKPLYHETVKAFEKIPESKALLFQDASTTNREMKAIKTFALRCAKLFPDDPGAFAKQTLESFYALTQQTGKGAISAAFMPSQLVTNWIWYRVIEGLKQIVTDYDQNERIQAIVDGRIKTDVVF